MLGDVSTVMALYVGFLLVVVFFLYLLVRRTLLGFKEGIDESGR